MYREHGALPSWPDGRPAFAFIHGNWALDNSRLENVRNYCGVNDELTILRETGMPFTAVVAATCLSAAFGSIVMGAYARYPIALAL